LAENGHNQALAEAIASTRTEELQSLSEDLGPLDLFEASGAVQLTLP
jgi:hypothetical protein